ncbi:MAG: 6-hydroxycyclohex-1-ene-1-carbonyl-CoA dehydrogenase [Bdellovibrionaceae bacterium]|nr:6-hydroxycyclohex-1-ene-1-carbonyl-CoA dehydrogenase [Bdellovibrionales bacterium]MCB9083822.1 6-hydroxycyclohex-1-ene-1-carbonyl-CoA dehydrogenase [Pseudobdellovibrionaceae bacterium]
MEPIKASGYFLSEFNKPLEKRDFVIDQVADDEVVVKVAGCGLCHTDITFYTGQVTPKHEMPLILGHEISGTVVATGSMGQGWMGKSVIVPAVLPCGECELCKNERDNICQKQLMPGNDFHGGFATHLKVPFRVLCETPENLGDFKLPQLSVIADAITTPYQSLKRSKLKKGDLAVVIGVGGIGIYMVQHAKIAGATVIAVDVDDKKLAAAQEQGADYIFSAKGKSEKDLKNEIRETVKANKLPRYFWKVFETSGTGAGQQTAFSLLSFGGTLAIVGFTMEKAPVRLSNLMAFDAEMFGNWGCRPQYYTNVVEDVLSKKIKLLENIQEYPLDDINKVIGLALEHKLEKRAIFVP